MENLYLPKSHSSLGNGDIAARIPCKPRKGFGRGMCLPAFGEGLSSERGGGEGWDCKREVDGGFACETLLKQIHGDRYERIWKDYNLLIPPVIPNEFVEACTLNDGVSEKVLGRGGFGFVVEALLIYPRGQMKEVVLKESHSKDRLEEMKEEARICMYLERTGYVPVCFGLTPSPKNEGVFRIIQECIGRGLTLHVAFRGLVPSSDYTQWLDIAFQLAEGLSKIHLLDVLVNDIKEDNILIDFTKQRPAIKYCDFGLSSYKKGVGYRKINRLRSPHLAPEHTGPSIVMTTKASDVFGLGRLIRNIYVTTKVPELIPIVKKMRYYDPTRRCSANEAVRDLSSVFLQYVSRKRLELQGDVSASSSSSSCTSISSLSTSSISSACSTASTCSTNSSDSFASATSKLPAASPAECSSEPSADQSPRITTPSEDASASAYRIKSTALSSEIAALSEGRANVSLYHIASASFIEAKKCPFVGSQITPGRTSSPRLSTLMTHVQSADQPAGFYTKDSCPELVMTDLGSPEAVDTGGSITIIPVTRLEDILLGGPDVNQSAVEPDVTSSIEHVISPESSSKRQSSPSLLHKVAGFVSRALHFGLGFFKA